MDGDEIIHYQKVIRDVLVREDIYDYVIRLVQATRVSKDYGLPYCKEWLAWGAGPRAGQNLLLGAKSRALFNGRSYITTSDVQAVAKPVMRHRIIANYAAVAEGITTDMVVDEIIENVSVPKETATV